MIIENIKSFITKTIDQAVIKAVQESVNGTQIEMKDDIKDIKNNIKDIPEQMALLNSQIELLRVQYDTLKQTTRNLENHISETDYARSHHRDHGNSLGFRLPAPTGSHFGQSPLFWK